MNCAECKYGHRREVSLRDGFPAHYPAFECRMNAPVVAVDGDGDELNPWPVVQSTDTCGQGVPTGQDAPALHAAKLYAEAVITMGELMARTDEMCGRIMMTTGIHREMY